ncbi:MAG: 2-dehydropantoate 2-reductase [Pseudomonadales bacterium]|nr:2-dehydropantoate 2-reductase [Pseudomonadales bacterium]
MPKIAIVGCGAMGSVYAALLASAGNHVVVADTDDAHVQAIASQGLRVTGASGDRVVRIEAGRSLNQSADLIVLAVKGAFAEAAAQSVVPHLTENTLVLTIQNGLGSADKVASVVGGDRLIVGVAEGFGASLQAPGHAHHNAMKAIRMGARAALDNDSVKWVVGLFSDAGFDALLADDIEAMQWEKLICNVAYSAPCALTGMTVGEVMDDPVVGQVSRDAATEAWQIARALGVAVSVTDPVQHVRDFAARMPDAKPSVLLDVQAGRFSEVGVINGAVPEQAAKVGLTAPVNATLTALVKALEQRQNK